MIGGVALEDLWAQGKTVTRADTGKAVGMLAPCQPDGVVEEVDENTRVERCQCGLNPGGCEVDGSIIRGPWRRR